MGGGWKGGEIKMEVGQRGYDVKKREEGEGKGGETHRLKKHRKREMERLRRNGRGMEGRGSLLPRDYGREREKKSEERGREQKSDSRTAAPNGFSGEREGREWRGGEGIMRGYDRGRDRFREVDGGRDKERWRLYDRLVKMESKKMGGESEKEENGKLWKARGAG